jgi:hypothetical protein
MSDEVLGRKKSGSDPKCERIFSWWSNFSDVVDVETLCFRRGEGGYMREDGGK